MAILLFVLYRITFVPRATPATSQPSSSPSVSTTALATATTGLQVAGAVESVATSPGSRPAATHAPDVVAPNAAVATPTEQATAQPNVTSARSSSPRSIASPATDATLAPSLSVVQSAVVAPAQSPEPSATAPVEWTGSYVIKSGDTLSTIATRLGVSLQELQKRNQIVEANRIQVGQKLIVPARP